ncbi:MAG TPA: hypothetical protein VMW52_05635 [Phycisphaerae bacterium]|nr:hypothetical protein [Phycisphaerae bacterium]
MALLTRKRSILVSQEAAEAPGDPVAGATHVLVAEPTITPDDTFQRRQFSRAFLGNALGVVGEHTAHCRFRTELRSDGTSALDAGLLILLQACGLALDTGVLSPTSVVASQLTATIDLYEDGLLKRISGAMGNVELTGEFGKQVWCAFDFWGAWAEPTDAEMDEATPNTQTPLRLASAAFTLGAGHTPTVANLGINLNNQVVLRPDITAAAAVIHALITERDPVVTLDAEAALVATHDAYGLWLAGTPAALSLLLTDTDVNVTIAAPAVQYRQVAEGDREGVMTHDLTGQCNAVDGDDELTITAADAGV